MSKLFYCLTFLALIFSFSASFSQCNYSIVLLDTFGDGWNGGQVTVKVGTTNNGPYTLASGGGPQTFAFPVTVGQTITVTYTAGNWPEENEYFIYNADGTEIFHDGPNPTANNTVIGTATCPSCISPTSLTATAISLNSATLGWTSTGTLFNIQYGPFGFPLGTGTIVNGITSNSYNLSGLTASSSYSFYVQNNCGPGNLSSWAGPFTFSTLTCLPGNQCAFVMSMHDIGNSWNGAGITVYQNGVNLGFFTITGGGVNIENVDLCNGANIQLFWTTGVYDNETSFQLLDPSSNIVFSWNAGGAPAAGLFYSFSASCTPVSCPAPTSPTVTNVSDVSATLNWVEPGTATHWQIEYGPMGFIHGTGTSLDVVSQPHVLSGLTPNTDYDFYVRSVCGTGDTSNWAGPVSFTTFLSLISNPSVCGIQVSIPDGSCIDLPISVSGVSGTQLGTDVMLTDFRFIIKHSWDGDINATLESPNGVTITLTSNNGGAGDNFGIIDGTCTGYTNFNMAGVNGNVTTGTPPFVGSFIPEGNMGNFHDNSNPNGTWILHVCDVQMADTGSVQFTELVFDPILPPATIVINELDCDQVGNDSLEFVELFDGGVGNYPLDGYTVVFYNGSTDQSYLSFDLDGYTTDPNGYFVIGNSNVTGASIIFTDNLLQNGADAAALYIDNATTFPAGTALTLTNLVDALVYETSDPTDLQLLTLLNPGQPQIDENFYNNKDIVSCSRIPNGTGGLRNTASYKPAIPTPKAINQPLPELVWLTGVFNEAFANDGSIANTINLELNNLTFVTTGTLVSGTDYTTANVPVGLNIVINANSDTTAIISLTGNAMAHMNINDINNLTITFLDAAYNGLSSAFVIGNSKNNLIVNFMDSPPPTLIWDNTIFNESVINNGSISDVINLRLFTETFSLSSGNMIPSTHFNTANVPAGLTVQIEATSDTTAIVSLVGNAINNNIIDDINNLSVSFLDAAFTGGSALNVDNYKNDSLQIHYIDPYYQDLSSSIVTDTIFVCNGCSSCSPMIYIHNNGPTTLLQNDTVFVYYQYAPLISPISDTIIISSDLLPSDSVLYIPTLNISQYGIYDFVFYVFSNSDNNNLNDTAYSIINSYLVSVDLGGINDTIITTSFPISLDAGTGSFPLTYIWSDSSADQTLSVNADGWYFVTITDIRGCTASDSVYVLQNSDFLDLAITINPSDTAFICNNCPCNYPTFSIINYGPNPVYQSDTIIVSFSYGSTPTIVTDTLILISDLPSGDTLVYNPAINIMQNGASTIEASIFNTNDYNSGNDTAASVLYAYQLSVSLGGVNDTLLINNFPQTLDAGSCTSPFGCSYAWSTTENTQTIDVSAENWYFVTVSDSHGCSAVDSVYVMMNPNLTDLSILISPSDTSYICNNCACNYPHFLIINNGTNPVLANDSIIISYLHAPMTAASSEVYILTTDLLPTDTIEFIPSLIITQMGSYSLQASVYNFNNINSVNDTAVSTIYAYTLTVDLGGANDTIVVSDWPAALFAGICTSPFSCNYVWSTGATSNVIGIIANDWYSITVTDNKGCKAIDSVFVYKPESIDEISDNNGIKVYPNPAKNKVNIEINKKNKGESTIGLYSVNGQLIKETKINGHNVINTSLNISELAPGVYFMRITSDENVQHIKLVVQ